MRPLRASIVVAAVVGAIGALSSTALAHGGDEMEVADLSMQPARILAQQALAELRSATIPRRPRFASMLRWRARTPARWTWPCCGATETLDGGDPQGSIPLLDEALSRPLGAASGKALHESGREFQPGTGAQEIVAIVAGALLLVLGAVLLGGARLRPRT